MLLFRIGANDDDGLPPGIPYTKKYVVKHDEPMKAHVGKLNKPLESNGGPDTKRWHMPASDPSHYSGNCY